MEILSRVRESIGVDNVGDEAAWIEPQPQTPRKQKFTNYVEPASD